MRVGYMSQAFSLYEEMSVRKNLEMHATLYRLRGSAARKAVQDALSRYQLAEVADILPRHLSLGLRQRLQLAAACLRRAICSGKNWANSRAKNGLPSSYPLIS